MENLQNIKQLLEKSDHWQQTAKLLTGSDSNACYFKNLFPSASAFFTGIFVEKLNRVHVFVLPEKEEAAYFFNDLKAIVEKDICFFLPDSFKRPRQFLQVDKENVVLRTETIHKLLDRKENQPLCLVTYSEAFFEKTIQQNTYSKFKIEIDKHKTLDSDHLLEQLGNFGFEIVDFVYEPGQASMRGGIIDIFSYANDYPYRIELFGDEVESIRVFDPGTQLSVKSLQSLSIVPDIQEKSTAQEKIALPDIFPNDTIVWLKDWDLINERIKNAFERFHEEVLSQEGKHKEDKHHFFRNAVFHNFENIVSLISKLEQFKIIEFGAKAHFNTSHEVDFKIEPQPGFNKNFDLLIEDLKKRKSAGYEIYLFCENKRQIERFYAIFEDLKADIIFHPIPFAIHKGFIHHGLKICCYTDHEIFQRFHKHNIKRGFDKNKALLLKTIKELQPGDYVTHIDHGVGVFSGLQKIDVNGKMQEAVRITYKDNDLLFVNINSLHKIAKFSSKEGTKPKINKLGSDAWDKVKRKAKKRIQDIAQELIKLYAKRRASKGYSFSKDTYLQNELEASFIYEDTPDQEKSTEDIKKDMEASYPMDRLICGDVGFGKTELAVRAAFKAVTDSKQVAILVPTTILSMQHYKTFKERLSEFPCNISYLNRFRSAKEKSEILNKVKEGQVDILIGTHAILSKKIDFKDLGLLIIDEEQKFGVKAKERLRQLKFQVDTLTLTATPIPRTLQFSLMGARDLSVIQTPPPNRQPVETQLHVFSEDVIRDAITHEVYRGGQVFFVHNRVKDIQEVAAMLKKLCPDVDFAVAHGQLDGDKLEKVMLDFMDHKFDVLVSTNIVESGLDIPNANTIIINNAHWFGLSDLHQLRGRVGRSNRKAFCYLFSPPVSGLPTDSRKRLQTIEQYSELGSGMNISMRDLDIRGAGNILGGEQSGFISEIGFDMYQKILDEAIDELKEKEFKELYAEELKNKKVFARDCQIDTDLEIMIPDSYIPNINERLSIYTQINSLKDREAMNKMMETLEDRFGRLPEMVKEIFKAVELRREAKELGFERLSIKNKKLKAWFVENQDSYFYQSEIFGNILQWVQQNAANCTLKQTSQHLILSYQPVQNINHCLQILRKMKDDVLTEKIS